MSRMRFDGDTPPGQAGGGGLAQGPGDAIADNEVVRGDGATALQGSVAILSDAGALSGLTQLDVDNLRLDGNTLSTTNVDGNLAIVPNGNGQVDIGGALSRLTANKFSDGPAAVFRLDKDQGGDFHSTFSLFWHSGDLNSARDFGMARVAAKVAKDTDGGAGLGWRQWAGEAYLAADGTNITTTFASTGLSVNLQAGRKYVFKLVLFLSDSIAADGVKIDFAGGTATETDFRAQVTAFDAALALSTQLVNLTDVASIATFTGNGSIEIHGSFEPLASGTFIPRYAQVVHTTGTLTVFRGSHLLVWDAP